jgi:NADH-quinone oxidoreductase subunit L
LAAIPPFAGFYSKDAILEVLVSASNMSSGGSRPWVAAVFLLVGGLTAFYIGRAYFLTFWTNERLPNEVAAHIHKPGLVMLGPVSLLALGSVVIGGVLEYRGFFDYYIHLSSPFGESKELGHTGGMGPWIAASVLIAGGGVGLAWWRYVWSEGYVGKIPQGLGGVYSLSAAKFFIDEIYALLIVKPAEMLATVSGWIDRVVDGLVDLVGWCMWLLGRLFRPMQNGQVQFYALAILLGLAIFCLVLISRWGG